MRIASVRRWHWLIIGLLVGLICGAVRDAAPNFQRELDSYGSRIGQREFEKALIAKFQGKPRFTDAVVHPYRLNSFSSAPVKLHVVSGLYWNGRTELEQGKLAARWVPAYFVASVPFRTVDTDGREFKTVLAYLELLKSSQGVQFRYDTWWWALRPLFLWTAGGVLGIGVIWPTIVNLLVFGAFSRPMEAAGESLWNVKTASTAPSPKPVLGNADSPALTDLERELESKIGKPDPQPASAAAPSQPARELPSTPLQPATVSVSQKDKDFGADKGDFYPTELRARHLD